ncbi:MAG: hypothetical protein QXG00_07940 [Candidatus Woesearchaeota archaeon]
MLDKKTKRILNKTKITVEKLLSEVNALASPEDDEDIDPGDDPIRSIGGALAFVLEKYYDFEEELK